MDIGQEGDARKFRRLRSSDYYVAKDAVVADKWNPKQFPRCRVCGQPITGQNFDGVDFRCKNEPL